MADETDYILKIVLVGDSRVGKSTFCQSIQGKNLSRVFATIGVDVITLHYRINDKNVSIKLCDTAGQERFQSIVRPYFCNFCGIVLMFDITKPSTFTSVEQWLNILEGDTFCQHSHPILLLGNKNDLCNKVSEEKQFKEKLDKLIDMYNVTYKELSCLHQSDLEETFMSFVTKILEDVSLNECTGVNRCTDYSSFRLSSIEETSGKCGKCKKPSCCNIL